MIDDIQEQNPESFNFQKYLGIARRRHFFFLIPLFIGWALVWSASWVLPPRYLSSTLILVEQPTMPKDYVTPNINDDLQERMQTITQQILSRTRLMHIIEQFSLYGTGHDQKSAEDKVERMRKDIGIELVRDTRNQISSFNVSYTSRDPHVAQQVTSELTNLFINENLEVRQQQSEDTTKFLESQLESSRKTLATQEDAIRQFKGQHVGEMPGQLASNLQILSGLQSQLQASEDALNVARQQHVYLQTLADQYKSIQRSTKRADGSAVGGLPALNQELEKLQARLDDLSSHYTDRHPDVRKLKEQIANTEKMRDQTLAAMKTKSAEPSTDASDSNNSGVSNLDPSESAMLLQVQSQLRSNNTEISNREHSIAALQAKVAEYQGRLNQEPVREQQLADLTRGYEQSKTSYDELLKKKNESKMATSMELLQQGERFRVVDPPSFPQKPDFPNRLKFCGIGLAVGMAFGGLAVVLAEMFDKRIHEESELKTVLAIPIISEIPDIIGPFEERRRRRSQWLGWATAAFVFGVVLIGSAFSYLHG